MTIRPAKLLKKKIRAGALQLVITIALLFFLLTATFLLRKGLTGQLISMTQTEEQLFLNIESAVTILEHARIQAPDSLYLSLYPEINDSTFLKIKPWGMFDIGLISTKAHNRQKQAAFLFGSTPAIEQDLPSLYFSDPDRYLSVSGDTYLGDNTYLPAYGIRSASINGTGYYGDRLVYGDQFKADSILPRLSQNLVDRYNQYLFINVDRSNTDYYFDDIFGKTLKQSFFQNTTLIESDENLDLSGTKLSGNIIVRSGGKITIGNTSQIDQCILIAKNIQIEEGFRGRGQFFASDSIVVGDNSQLLMPSILTVINPKGSCLVELEKGVSFSGDIIMYTESKELLPSLKINEKCKLIGQVYCHGYCDFKAALYGSLYIKGFVAITENSFNQNLLLNACIDVGRMPAEFAGVTFFDKETRLKHIETLY